MAKYVCSEPVSIHSATLPEIVGRLNRTTISEEPLLNLVRRLFEATLYSEVPELSVDDIVQERRHARNSLLERIRTRAQTDDDALAAVVTAEIWAKGASQISAHLASKAGSGFGVSQ